MLSTIKAILNEWHSTAGMTSGILLGICSLGLIIAYCVLIHNIKKYFGQQMETEMRRLKILFATFIISYFLRTFYQIGLTQQLFSNLIHQMIIRWFIINSLPLIWDICSILSILVFHYKSFRILSEDEK